MIFRTAPFLLGVFMHGCAQFVHGSFLGFLVRLYFLATIGEKYLEKSDVVCANATFCPYRMLF